MRAYSTAVVASALRVDRRWLDTVIADHSIDGVRRERQGVSRAISPDAVLTLAVAIELMEALQVPAGSALRFARALLLDAGEHSPARGVVLHVDVPAIERRMAARLTEAVEAHPPPRRGRPPRPR
jgi:hypothetical protein